MSNRLIFFFFFISRSRFTTQRIYIGVTVVGKKKEKEKQNENESIAHSIVYKTRTGLCGLLELGKERKDDDIDVE